MADNRTYLQAQKFRLAVSTTSTDTSIDVEDFTFPDDTNITSSDIGNRLYATIEPGSDREEAIYITGVTQNGDGTATLTVTRGVKFGPDYTTDSSLRQPHAANSILVISNTAAFYDTFANKENDETISETWTFENFPQKSGGNTPSSNNELATKAYVDATASGSADLINTQLVTEGDAGETVAEGDVVYMDESDGEWKKTDGTTAATVNNTKIGIAQGSGTDGNDISGGVVIDGVDKTDTYTAGQVYYVSDTNGELATSAGTNERIVGVGDKEGNLLILDPYELTKDQKDALAGTSGTPSDTNRFKTQDDNISGEFGDGSDGDVTISSNTTLTEDKFYNNLTVDNGVTLDTAGYRIFVRNKLTNNGTIENNGEPGTNGSVPGGGSGGAGAPSGTLAGGTDGADGGDGANGGSGGSNGSAANPSLGVDGLDGGDSHDGGGSTAGSGGTGGTATSENAEFYQNTNSDPTTISANTPKDVTILLYLLRGDSSGLTLSSSAGAGGGAGGDNQTFTNEGGGGGGGGGSGGVVFIVAREIDNTNGAINCDGGDGGNGADDLDRGGGGGGAGGAGGVIVLIYQDITVGSISASGGSGGSGGNGSGSADGDDGDDGNVGNIYRVNVSLSI